MLGFTIMASIQGLGGGHSHGGQEEVMDHEGHQHPLNMTGNHDHDDTNHDEDHKSHELKNGYDHFHEEYDLNHGDHYHHIESHDLHVNLTVGEHKEESEDLSLEMVEDFDEYGEKGDLNISNVAINNRGS